MQSLTLKLGIVLLIGLLPACGAAAPPPDPISDEIAVATLPPTATATLVPTNTPLPPPTATATPVVVAQVAEPTEPAEPEPTVAPTETPLPEPTATPTPDIDWLTVSGRTENSLMVLGNPDAPVTMVDFSDFM